MKIKPLAMLAITGLAASFAYIVPALADDLANANTEPTAVSPASDGNTPTQIASNNTDGANTTQSDASANVGNDEGTPDTATGDDDY